MAFTFRPSIGADIVLAGGVAGLVSIDLHDESGGAIVLTRNLFGLGHQYVSGGAPLPGTAGSDTLFGNDDVGSPDIVFWDPLTVNQIVSPSDFTTPFSNNAAASIDVVVLGAGDDILTLAHDATALGNPGAYTLSMTGYGGTGNDIMWMGAGADVVFGDSGNDLIAGQGGNDTLGGNSGLDTLYGGSGDDLLLADLTEFSQIATPFDITISTGDGVNFVHSSPGGSNAIWSDDLYDGGADNDSIRLTTGNDVLLMNNADLRINGVAQTDTGDHIVAIEAIDGGNGNDIVVVNDSEDAVAYTGNLTITGGANRDLLVSGNGNDLITGGALTGAMGGGDIDTIFGGAGNDTIYGETTTDPLTTTGGTDTIYGGAGLDTIFGGAANDTVMGDANRDTLYGGAADDTLYGGANIDTLSGDVGVDLLSGDDGNDVLLYSADADLVGEFVYGWNGEVNFQAVYDILLADGTATTFDSFVGGAGIDTIDLRSVTVPGNRLYFGTQLEQTFPNFMTGVEVVLAGATADVIILSKFDPFLDDVDGYAENVTVVAGGADDLVFSGLANDLVLGDHAAGTLSDGDGDDTLFGGLGNDTIYGDSVDGQSLGAPAGNDTIQGGPGGDTIFGGNGDDVLSEIDSSTLFGGDGADLLLFNIANASVNGRAISGAETAGDGDDRVFVSGEYNSVTAELGAGNDVYIGVAIDDGGEGGALGNSTDIVAGGTGSDLISTWQGDDTLDGGDGGDVIWGGSGVDTIQGGADSDYLYGGFGNGDLLIGGDGGDFYYWARNDGIDRVEDQDPGGVTQDNYILVFAGFSDFGSGDDLDGDGFIDGAGVFEIDGNLYDNDGDDMVQITVDPEDSSRFVLTVLQGEGAGSSLNFDPDEITMIGLSNSDTGQVTAYQWVDIMGHPQGGEYQLLA